MDRKGNHVVVWQQRPLQLSTDLPPPPKGEVCYTSCRKGELCRCNPSSLRGFPIQLLNCGLPVGYRYGNGEIVDGMVKDGLWDVYNDFAMGVAADQTAEEHGISREASVCSRSLQARLWRNGSLCSIWKIAFSIFVQRVSCVHKSWSTPIPAVPGTSFQRHE